MTTITSPDGDVLDTRPHHMRPTLSSIHVHGVDARWDVRVGKSPTTGGLWLDLGPVTIHADGDTHAERVAHLAAIGRAITAQAEEAMGDPLDRLATCAECGGDLDRPHHTSVHPWCRSEDPTGGTAA